MPHGSKAAKEDSSLSPYSDIPTSSGASYTSPRDLPKSKGAEIPTLEDITKKCQDDEKFWEQRNMRMLDHQDLFDLKEKQAPPGQILAYMNDTKVLIEKLSAIAAKKLPRVQVPARDDTLMDIAQRIENGIKQWDNHTRQGWFGGLHNPLDFDRAQSLFLRGWLCERLMLNPDNEMLVDDVLFDPYNIYPRLSGQRIQHVSHIFETTIDDLTETFDYAKERWADSKGTTSVKCYSYYGNAAPYWHAIVSGDDWVKKPTKLDYFPWVLAVAKGAIGHYPIGNQSPEEHAAYIGCGYLDSIASVYKLINKFLTILANATAKQENPPKVVHTINGESKTVDLSTGGTSWLLSSEKLELLDVGPKIGQLMPLLSALQDRMSKGGLPSALYGEGVSLDSGFMSAILMSAAQDNIWTFINALAQFHGLRYKKFLELFRDWAIGGIDILTKAKGKAGRMVFSGKLTAEDIDQNGTYVDVSYDDISPQDRTALANVAALLTREKVISMHTAREKYLGLDDPELEESRVLSDLLLMNPEFLKRAALLEWKKLGRKKELAGLVEELEQKELAPKQPQLPGMNAPGAEAAMGGTPPEALMGMPPEVSPTGVVDENMVPGAQELIAQLLQGG